MLRSFSEAELLQFILPLKISRVPWAFCKTAALLQPSTTFTFHFNISCSDKIFFCHPNTKTLVKSVVQSELGKSTSHLQGDSMLSHRGDENMLTAPHCTLHSVTEYRPGSELLLFLHCSHTMNAHIRSCSQSILVWDCYHAPWHSLSELSSKRASTQATAGEPLQFHQLQLSGHRNF